MSPTARDGVMQRFGRHHISHLATALRQVILRSPFLKQHPETHDFCAIKRSVCIKSNPQFTVARNGLGHLLCNFVCSSKNLFRGLMGNRLP